MSYSIRWSDKAKDQLRKLPGKEQERIVKRVASLSDNPRSSQTKRLKVTGHLRRIRSGDYRVLYEVKDKVLRVLVIRVGHRKNVYKNLPEATD